MINDLSRLNHKTFGDRNADKKFLVIQQKSSGRCLFSLVSAVICWIDFAEKNNLIPVVDFENYSNEYSEPEEVKGIFNSFEFYFEPISSYALSEVYNSKNVFFTSNGFPIGYSLSIHAMPNLLRIYKKYVRIRPEILDEVDSISVPTAVGLHYRGQEMRYAPGHWLPPTKKQVLHSLNLILRNSNCDLIYICTEDQILLESIIEEYGSMVIYRDHYRTTGTNEYRMDNPRINHKYHLGLEILIDCMILAKCQSFIGCTSNVASFTRFLNNRNYVFDVEINNGPNKWPKPFNYMNWPLKTILPPGLGGFRIDKSTIRFLDK